MSIKTVGLVLGLMVLALLLLLPPPAPTQAQTQPTPIVITLTPAATPGPSATPAGAVPDDYLEPNNTATTATTIGLGTLPDLTLVGADVDAFSLYVKAGQLIAVTTTVAGDLDTRLRLFWQGRLVADNDDAGPTNVGAQVTWPAPADGWLSILVTRVTVHEGYYDLTTALAAPPATATPAPTLTPNATATPLLPPDAAEPNDSQATAWPLAPGVSGSYSLTPADIDTFTFVAKAGLTYACATVTAQVDTYLTVTDGAGILAANDDRQPGALDSYVSWTAAAEQVVWLTVTASGGGFGLYEFGCVILLPTPPPAAALTAEPAPAGSGAGAAVVATSTAPDLTPATPISLTVQHLGRVAPVAARAPTTIRLLIYYDANNDRAPGPGEGVAAVSVLAIDGRGRQLAQTFTNAQGEAVFSLTDERVDRILVPFVSGWSAPVRAGAANEDIVLGLPAVRLPVFLPVQAPISDAEA